MRNAAYIGAGGTLMAFIVTGFVQFVPAGDEAVKFLSWTVPSVIALISWAIQLFVTLKKVRRYMIADVMKEVKHELETLEPIIAKRVVDELWYRIPTILELDKRKEKGDADQTQ